MNVRNKRTGFPVESNNETSACSQSLASQEASDVQLQFLKDKWELIGALSWKDYLAHGRGALVFTVSSERDDDWDCTYLPLGEIQDHPLMGGFAERIKQYDPEIEVVAIFLRPGGFVDAYRGSPAPKRLGPRQAYERLASAGALFWLELQ